MQQHRLLLRFAIANILLGGFASHAADTPRALTPDSSFTINFPDLPPTFHAVASKQSVPAKMTVYLPRNYDRAKKHPLLVFLSGGDGGDGTALSVARDITGQQDFVCVNMPLFRAPDYQSDNAGSPGNSLVITEPDGRAMWPHFKMMLEKVDSLVPNIDPNHRVIGGSSNGAHATVALIDGSDGDICKLFSAFLIVEGGGKLKHYEHLKEKRYLMVSSSEKSKPRALEITEQAKAAGAGTTFVFQDIGTHGFPKAAYPAVMKWLRITVTD